MNMTNLDQIKYSLFCVLYYVFIESLCFMFSYALTFWLRVQICSKQIDLR